MKLILAMIVALAACSTETVGLDPQQDAADGGVFVVRQAAVLSAHTIRTEMNVDFSGGWPDGGALMFFDSVYSQAAGFQQGWDVEVFVSDCQYFTFNDCTAGHPCPVGHLCTWRQASRQTVIQLASFSTKPGACNSDPGAQATDVVGGKTWRLTTTGAYDSALGYVQVAWTPIRNGTPSWQATKWENINTDCNSNASCGNGVVSGPGAHQAGLYPSGCPWWEAYAGTIGSCHEGACTLENNCTVNPSGFVIRHKACWQGSCNTDQSKNCWDPSINDCCHYF